MDVYFFFSSRRRHTRLQGDWSSDVCSSDLGRNVPSHVEYARRIRTEITAARHSLNASANLPLHQAASQMSQLRKSCSERSEERRVGKGGRGGGGGRGVRRKE